MKSCLFFFQPFLISLIFLEPVLTWKHQNSWRCFWRCSWLSRVENLSSDKHDFQGYHLKQCSLSNPTEWQTRAGWKQGKYLFHFLARGKNNTKVLGFVLKSNSTVFLILNFFNLQSFLCSCLYVQLVTLKVHCFYESSPHTRIPAFRRTPNTETPVRKQITVAMGYILCTY